VTLIKTYQRYIIKELFKISLFLLCLFSAFYIIIDFFEKLGDFLKYKKPLYLFIIYIFWKLWVILYQIYPFVLALSGLVAVFLLSKNNELIAFLSLGFRKREIARVFGSGLLILSLFGGLLLNVIFPKAAYKSLYTWNYKIKHYKKQYLIFNKQIFFVGPNYYLIARPLEPKGEYLGDIKLVFIKNGEPEEVIWAKQGYYIGDHEWKLLGVSIQKKAEMFKPHEYAVWKKKLPFVPRTLVIVEKPVEFLSFKGLLERYRFLKKVHRPYIQVFAEMVLKIYYVFAGFIVGFFPIYIFLREYAPKKKGGIFLRSIMHFFLLLVLFLLLETLFRKGIVFAGIGIGVWIIANLLMYILFF